MIRNARRQVTENSRWRVFFDDVTDELGRNVPDFLVVSPKRQGPDLASGVLVLPERYGQIGLLLIHRHVIDRAGYETVKGFLDGSEPGPVAAARELAEEAGLGCAPDHLIHLGRIAPEAGTLEGLADLYLARDCHELDAPPPSDDAGPGGLVWFSWDEAVRLALGSASGGPMLLYAMSVICVLRAAHRVGHLQGFK